MPDTQLIVNSLPSVVVAQFRYVDDVVSVKRSPNGDLDITVTDAASSSHFATHDPGAHADIIAHSDPGFRDARAHDDDYSDDDYYDDMPALEGPDESPAGLHAPRTDHIQLIG